MYRYSLREASLHRLAKQVSPVPPENRPILSSFFVNRETASRCRQIQDRNTWSSPQLPEPATVTIEPKPTNLRSIAFPQTSFLDGPAETPAHREQNCIRPRTYIPDRTGGRPRACRPNGLRQPSRTSDTSGPVGGVGSTQCAAAVSCLARYHPDAVARHGFLPWKATHWT